jgi:hypothetical protein
LFAKGELEHRTSKSRYKRTSRKFFVKQLAEIERRQARIRRIRQTHENVGLLQDKDIAQTPEAHHHIGKSENFPEHVGTFLQKNSGDPAVKVMGSD